MLEWLICRLAWRPFHLDRRDDRTGRLIVTSMRARCPGIKPTSPSRLPAIRIHVKTASRIAGPDPGPTTYPPVRICAAASALASAAACSPAILPKTAPRITEVAPV